MALMLLKADASVQVVHSQTPELDLVAAVGGADIVVSAVGKPGFIKGEWVKAGSVVIDVGINAVADASKKAGYRLAGTSPGPTQSDIACPVPQPASLHDLNCTHRVSSRRRKANHLCEVRLLGKHASKTHSQPARRSSSATIASEHVHRCLGNTGIQPGSNAHATA